MPTTYGPAFLKHCGTQGGAPISTNCQLIAIRKKDAPELALTVPNSTGITQSEHYDGTHVEVEITLRVKAAYTLIAAAALITITGDFADDYVVDSLDQARKVGDHYEVTYSAHNNSGVDYSVVS
tara:strand:- start:2744 stop:3115 length:372 start_codon:yes stop_codon:yes gene_type:complete